MSAQPPPGPDPPRPGPPRPPTPPQGMTIGMPGGVFGPPGGLRAWTPSAPVAVPGPFMAPLPGGGPGGVAPMPGGMAPPGLPDLQAVGRAAMAEVLEGNAAAAAARDRVPDLIEQADLVRAAAAMAAGAPAGAAPAQAAPVPESVTSTVPAQAQLVPAQQMAPAPGVWRGPPPGWQQPQAGWHGAPPAWQQERPAPVKQVVNTAARERDLAQRIGDGLYPLVRWIRNSRAGWIGVVALFGITLPIILLRQDFDARLRLVLGFFSFIFWIQLLSELVPG